MRRSRLFFTSLMALTLGITSCKNAEKVVQKVDVEVSQTVRKTGDFFNLDEITVYLTFNSGKELIDSSNSLYNNLSVILRCPEQGAVKITNDNYVLEDIGTYDVEVTYNPISNYIFPVTGYASFDVVDRIVPATSLSLGSDSLSLSTESTKKIDYLIQPEDCTSNVYFESNDPSVAEVSKDGVVTGVGEGQCIVTTFVDDFKQDCLITVSPSEKIDYVFSTVRFETSKGDWKYSEPGIKKLNNGINVTSETTITSPVSYTNITKIKYNVANNSIENLGNSNDVEISTYIGEELIGVDVVSSSDNELTPSYEIKNKSGVVSLKIKPKGSNNSSFTIQSISINYNGEPIYPTSISLKEGLNIPINSKEKMTISYTPKQTNQRIIEWESADESILTIARDGTITALKEGNTNVTAKAKTESGYITASISVRTYKVIVRSIEVDKDTLNIFVNNTKQINYSVSPEQASYKEVTFESSNKNIATVDETGNVAGIKTGECVVTITSVDEPSVITNVKIVVTERPPLEAHPMSYNLNDFSGNTFAKKDSAPSLDKTKFLVIPVWFKDSSEYISNKNNVKIDIQKSFFGTSEDTGWESVKTFYETESNGRLSIKGTVSDWYEVNYSHNLYNYDLDSPRPNSKSIYDLVNDATNWYFNTHSDNRKNYDCDQDGYLDGVILIYGCPDRAAFYSKNKFAQYGESLWAFTTWLGNSAICDVNKPNANCFLWASYDFMYSEKTSASRTKANPAYGSGNTTNCLLDTHTYIHEVGHMFGLDDYYDYSNKYNPASGFSMQDYNVGAHDPFSCLALGWADAYVPYEDCQITLTPFQSSHQVILLSPSFNSANSPFDEYLLLELYTPTGLNKFDTDYLYRETYPRGVNETGIRLWHVDARLVEVRNSFNGAYSDKSYVVPFKNNAMMMSNTYASSSSNAYISPCGEEYADFNLLQLIRNNSKETYHSKSQFSKSDLFLNGSSFNMNTFKKQFVFNGKLNSGATLDWSFSVSIKGSNENAVATITLNKD
ncbi:MAG: Ig-like domain-containing protein [Bacilli bacterium]|nr:Ig-like domain-containing protein [Bacilli bacterium]